MRYELMVVLSTKSDSSSIITGIEKSLKEASAADLKVDHLGKKQLAFQISKQNEGDYYEFNFEAPPEAVKNINDKLRLEREAILRYLIIKSRLPKADKKKTAKLEAQQLPKVTVKTVTASKPPVAARKAIGKKPKAKSQKSKRKK